jgi:alkyl hydroperoxide reductase subunit AhpC
VPVLQRPAPRLACAKESLDAAGITVVALSVDEKTSSELVEKLHLDFPIAHSADDDEVADTLGSYLNDEPRYVQSTGFVLAPDGSLVTAVYFSGAIGRLLPDDVIGLRPLHARTRLTVRIPLDISGEAVMDLHNRSIR